MPEAPTCVAREEVPPLPDHFYTESVSLTEGTKALVSIQLPIGHSRETMEIIACFDITDVLRLGPVTSHYRQVARTFIS